jgi:hypothetical protein
MIQKNKLKIKHKKKEQRMNSLLKNLSQTVSQTIDDFSQKVADKFKVDKNEVLALWNEQVSDELKVEKTTEKKKASPRKISNAIADAPQCSYKFGKGKNKGQNCPSKVVDGIEYCKKHAPKTAKTEKAPAKAKKPEMKQTTIVSKVDEATDVIKSLNSKVTTIKNLCKNKYNHFEDLETHLLFSQETREVYGKQLEDGTVAELSLQDIELCKKQGYGFVPPSTIKNIEPEVKKVEAKQEAKVEVKPVPKIEAKTEPKVEVKPVPKVEVKPPVPKKAPVIVEEVEEEEEVEEVEEDE